MTRKPKIVDMTPDYGHGGLGKEVNQNRILMDSNRSLDVSHRYCAGGYDAGWPRSTLLRERGCIK